MKRLPTVYVKITIFEGVLIFPSTCYLSLAPIHIYKSLAEETFPRLLLQSNPFFPIFHCNYQSSFKIRRFCCLTGIAINMDRLSNLSYQSVNFTVEGYNTTNPSELGSFFNVYVR